jgi:hypothetical protein
MLERHEEIYRNNRDEQAKKGFLMFLKAYITGMFPSLEDRRSYFTGFTETYPELSDDVAGYY